MLFSGIDLHKRSIAIHTLDADGAVVRAANLPAQRNALTAYFGTLPGPHRAVVECTGMWYWVRDLLVPQGIDLRLGHAKYLKAISYAKVKTDAVDAATLAQLLRVDLIPEAHMISPALRETRDLLRARLVLVSRTLRCQRSIGALFEKYNVATPADLPELPRLEAALHAEQHTLLKTQVRRLERQLRDRVLPTPEAQRLVWIPGIGAMVAYTLLLEIDDIRRDAAAQALARRESLSQARVPPCRRPCRAVFPRNPDRVSPTHSPQRQSDCARPHRQGARLDCLSRADQTGGVQWTIPWTPADSHQTPAVAPPGKPARLTGASERPHA